ncbi:ribonuclease BN [Thermocladium modestius]|uniref:pyruvate synthase n=1 Tax=Thermocladium modestius TaxID=62609 RepID=A0A830GSZ0_9CREN|nr:2-oxoacid:acceptor oxidoreductase family protein [Thermocladium modestius]GGP20026.1 ribonuclease BN [Thermocladium modestius]
MRAAITMNITDILILGRGGQGGVTAARILVSAAMKEGKWGQAMPEFGAERRGAVVRSYARIGMEPVMLHSAIKRADIIMMLTHTILNQVDVMGMAKSRSTKLIINSPAPIKTELPTYWVNANQIAEDLGLVIAGWHVVNTSMLGALSKATGLVKLDSILDSLGEFIRGSVLKQNIEAVRRAFNETEIATETEVIA